MDIAHVLRTTYMRIRDYCQKMENPYFGAKQPADIYYMMSAVTGDELIRIVIRMMFDVARSLVAGVLE